ncbi:VWA domain-containing protein [candidate division KSB1 bacterium]|nr:VWA domain-containing protein [candidate division KSB1 bacterium]
MNSRISTLVISIFLISVQSVFAIGALFSRPLWSNATYNKMWIKTVDATVDVQGQVAVTHVDQVFRNEMNTVVEAVWIFPLPKGAVVSELYYWFNGIRYKGDVRERQAARNAYEGRIRQSLDPALLEYMGDNLYRLSIAPINANSDVRTEITYVQMLPYEFGSVAYTFLLNAVGLSPKPLNRVSISGKFESQNPYKHFHSPSHDESTATLISKTSDFRYDITFGDENFMPDKDLYVEFETRRDQVDVNMLRYTPTAGDSLGGDSFYAIWITPPDEITDEEILPRRIVMTADVSSSMEGLRITQLKQSLMTFLDNLAPQDKFNIVTFGTTVVKFQPDLVDATNANIQNARTFVTDIGALGLTNISDALTASLQQTFDAQSTNMIIFLTDGYPTWGTTFIPDILQKVREQNTHDVRIFSFGIGNDVSETLLTQLAVENGGYVSFIQQDADIAKVIANHFMRISKPVIKGLDIYIDGLVTAEKFPRPLPDLFWGNQVMQLGIYKNSGSFPVYLTGTLNDREITLNSTANFPQTPGGHRFIPRLWASAKIDYLLDQIAIYGEKDELVDQVVELSIIFQILTPYTAFYSDPNDPGDGENTAVAEQKEKFIPDGFELAQNFPNPFNPSTTIGYKIPVEGNVTLRIYDLSGRLVKVLVAQRQRAGIYQFNWDGTDSAGKKVAAGVYLYRLEISTQNGEKFVRSRKMSLVR